MRRTDCFREIHAVDVLAQNAKCAGVEGLQAGQPVAALSYHAYAEYDLADAAAVVPLPDALGRVQAFVGEWLPGKPISRDNFRSLQLDSVVRDDGLAALGIVATPMEAVMPRLLAGDERQRDLDRHRRG